MVRGLSAVVLRTARGYRLTEADVWDVHQDTWAALACRLHTLRDGTRLPAWLVTTARRRARRVAERAAQGTPGAGPPESGVTPSAEAAALLAERDRALWAAVAALPERPRRLLWLLAHHPELTHAELAAELGISAGSVGPLCRRYCAVVRRRLHASGLDELA